MAYTSSNDPEEQSLSTLLENADAGMAQLFVKVMNLHSGYQIEERSSKQLADAVRLEIDRSFSEERQIESDEPL